MNKQKIFKASYIRKLQGRVENHENLDFYNKPEFIIDENQVRILPEIKQPVNLYAKMNPNDDFQSAVALFEVYKDLKPIEASDHRLWTYLSHVDLFPYMQERWNGEKSSKYILDHWFLQSSSQSNLLSDNLSGLWWAVHISKDETRDNKYELTKVLFKQRDFAFRTLGTYKLARHKEAVLGILEFMKENEEVLSYKRQKKSRLITGYLNMYGGTKPLSYYSKNHFKVVLEGLKPKLIKI